MRAPALRKPAPEPIRQDDSPIVAELRLRCTLRTDGERVADRLEELLTAYDLDPSEDARTALMRAATHLRVTGSKRHYLTTIVNSLRTLTGEPVILTCSECGHWIIVTLAGKVTCGECAVQMVPKPRRTGGQA
jgi:hypothetical protein